MKKLFFLLIFSALLFNSCKKEEGQEPYIINNSVTSSQISLEVDGFENLDGNLAIAINNSSQQFMSNTESYRDTVIDVSSNDMIIPIEDIIPGTYAIVFFMMKIVMNNLILIF